MEALHSLLHRILHNHDCSLSLHGNGFLNMILSLTDFLKIILNCFGMAFGLLVMFVGIQGGNGHHGFWVTAFSILIWVASWFIIARFLSNIQILLFRRQSEYELRRDLAKAKSDGKL